MIVYEGVGSCSKLGPHYISNQDTISMAKLDHINAMEWQPKWGHSPPCPVSYAFNVSTVISI